MPRKRDDWDRALERLKNEYAFIELWSMGDDVLYYVDFVELCIDRIKKSNPCIKKKTWKENCRKARERSRLSDKDVADKIGISRGAIYKVERICEEKDETEAVGIDSIVRFLKAFSLIYLENPYVLLGIEPEITIGEVLSCQSGTDILSKYMNSCIMRKENVLKIQARNRGADEATVCLSLNEKAQVIKKCLTAIPAEISGSTETDKYIEYINHRYICHLVLQNDEYIQYVVELLKLQHKTAKDYYSLFQQFPAIKEAIREANLPEGYPSIGNKQESVEILRSLSSIAPEEERKSVIKKLYQLDSGIRSFQCIFPEYIEFVGKMLLVPPVIQELLLRLLRDAGLFNRSNVFTDRKW